MARLRRKSRLRFRWPGECAPERSGAVFKRIIVALLAAVTLALTTYLLRLKSRRAPTGTLRVERGAGSGSYRVGNFVVRLEAGEEHSPALEIRHLSDPGRVVWRSVSGESFVSAARGRERVRGVRAHYRIRDEVLEEYTDQTVDRVEREGAALVVRGKLLRRDGSGEIGYSLAFAPASDGRLRFEAEVEEPCNRVYLTYASDKNERFFGFGEQFTHLDLKGRKVPVFIGEQGIGRGAQPVTFLANMRAGSGGSWYSTYAVVPQYITSRLRSLFLENYEYSAFDLRDESRVRVEVFSRRMTGQIQHGDTPEDLIREYTEYAGRMRPLPEWIMSGAVVGVQGGPKRALEIYGRLKRLDTPVAALWLQDWVGQRKTSFGEQLWWNWELDEVLYPNWEKLLAELDRDGVKLMTYINPFVVDVSGRGKSRRSLFEEAKRSGYLVEGAGGGSYMVEITDFSAALVDLTNPEAREWIKSIIKENLIGGGVSGWMADFGEGLPYDAALYSGESPKEFHNRYAEEWAKVNREAIREAGREDDIVFFSRSGYTKSPGYATLFWAGDQIVSWDRHDGIESALTGMLSGGFSGYSLNHSDTGGYTTITARFLRYHRSQELLMRWTELSAFTAVLRTHEGSQPTRNYQIYSDEESLRHFSRFAKVYAALKPYRSRLVREASENGLPLVRHPFVHYPDDPKIFGLDRQFMLGSEFMVAPVVEPGAKRVEVYLPIGRWVHVWSGEIHGSKARGVRERVRAPIGEPAIFYREDSRFGEAFRRKLAESGLL